MCGGAAWPGGVLGSHKMANCNAKGGERVTARLGIIFRDKTKLYRKVFNGFLSPCRLVGATRQ